MQNWFDIASQDSAVLYQRKKVIGAMMIIITASSPGQLTWYKYQKDKLIGKTTHKNIINIAEWIFDIINPIFEMLSSDD